MIPVKFDQANCAFGPPPDLAESQCRTIHGFIGEVANGSVDGAKFIVTAWKPTPEELAELNAGGAVFLSFLGGLPPHLATTNFQAATTIA